MVSVDYGCKGLNILEVAYDYKFNTVVESEVD